jgi:pyruvate kinase
VKTQGRPASAWDRRVVADLIQTVGRLRQDLIALEAKSSDRLRSVNPAHRAGAVNLLHYVGLRRHDVRQLQEQLAWLGLSSLGRAESHVLANLDKVLGLLHTLAGDHWRARSDEEPAGSRTGPHLLQEHAESLLGLHRPGRRTRIMVTLATEAAHDYSLVRGMLAAGMDCARINCAHDDEGVWAAMLANIARARRELGRPCRVLMDLAGPKLRTGEIAPGPAVLKWRPVRDAFGRVTAPARILLTPADAAPGAPGADACLPVDARWLSALLPGNQVELSDARGARRTLKVVATAPGGVWAEAAQTTYVTPETILRVSDGASGVKGNETRPARIDPVKQPLLLRPGDMLVLTRENVPGRPAEHDAAGRLLRSASIPCTLPEVFGNVQAGERVWLDDGRIGGIIRHVTRGEIHLEITAAREDGERLGADKGINLPDSTLTLPALSAKDLRDLEFVAARADLVGLSFVQRPSDVEQAQAQLAQRRREDLGIVLKIETRTAFENLPDLLLTAMRSPRIGVMIARGDLAVELGYERLAEVQEEILWLAEAAHVPLIWATQVLESMAKRGLPSRAEITDAAMGERAECVMLNKGPHVLEAIQALDDILLRMEAHQHKKRSMLRRLHW